MYQNLQSLQIYLSASLLFAFKKYFNLINQAPTYNISNTSDVIFITQQDRPSNCSQHHTQLERQFPQN